MVMNNRKSDLVILSILLLALSMWHFGHRQLGGFDMSALVDTGWRMANNQTPYIDFPLTTPVAFYIGADWAIRFFGARWSSFVIITIIFTITSFLAQYGILTRIVHWKLALAISFVSHLLCSVITSYWWYNPITMNASCVFLSAAYLFANKPQKIVSAISFWASLTILSLMKPNIAGSLAGLVFISLFVSSSSRIRLISIGLTALISFFVILLILKVSPSVVVTSYFVIGKERAMPTLKWFFNDKPYEHWVVLPFLVLSILPMLKQISETKYFPNTPDRFSNLAVTMASFATGVLSLLTNSDSNLTVGIPFFLLSSTLFGLLFKSGTTPPKSQKIWNILAIFFISGIMIGSTIIQANFHAIYEEPNMLAFWYILEICLSLTAIFLLFWDSSPKTNFAAGYNWQNDKIVWVILIVATGVVMYAGGMRWRVSYIGYESFFTYSQLTKVEDVLFFDNFYVSPTAKVTISEIRHVLQESYDSREDWENLPVYFGTRIEFAYAAFGIASPRNLPIWWHPSNSYPANREQYYIKSFFDHAFKTAIFIKQQRTGAPDFGYLPKKVIKELLTNYDRTDLSTIVVFQKNGE